MVKIKFIKVLFSETKYWPKATPQKTPRPAHICICKAPAAGKYSFPNIKTTIGLANIDIGTARAEAKKNISQYKLCNRFLYKALSLIFALTIAGNSDVQIITGIKYQISDILTAAA